MMQSNRKHGHPIIVPGNPEGSHLYESVENGSMPAGSSLTDQEIGVIRAWIEAGAQNN